MFGFSCLLAALVAAAQFAASEKSNMTDNVRDEIVTELLGLLKHVLRLRLSGSSPGERLELSQEDVTVVAARGDTSNGPNSCNNLGTTSATNLATRVQTEESRERAARLDCIFIKHFGTLSSNRQLREQSQSSEIVDIFIYDASSESPGSSTNLARSESQLANEQLQPVASSDVCDRIQYQIKTTNYESLLPALTGMWTRLLTEKSQFLCSGVEDQTIEFPTCVQQLESGSNTWSSDSCNVISHTRTETICGCSQLGRTAVSRGSHNPAVNIGTDFDDDHKRSLEAWYILVAAAFFLLVFLCYFLNTKCDVLFDYPLKSEIKYVESCHS